MLFWSALSPFGLIALTRFSQVHHMYRRIKLTGWARVWAIFKRGLMATLWGMFIVVMIVIPIPVASFIEAAKRRLRRNQPALIVRDDDGDRKG